MTPISLFRRLEGTTSCRSYVNLYLDKIWATRLGFGICVVLPFKKMMRKFDIDSEELYEHKMVLVAAFRLRRLDWAMFFKFNKYYTPK